MQSSNEPKIILLDTHVWLWYASGVSQGISRNLRTLIEKLTPNSAVKLSAISLWEIGILVMKDKITLIPSVKEWVYKALGDTRVSVEDIHTDIALESTLLPRELRGDPADRIIIATAKHLGATLITRDKEILSYSKKHGFQALSI